MQHQLKKAHGPIHPAARHVPKSQDCKLSGFGSCNSRSSSAERGGSQKRLGSTTSQHEPTPPPATAAAAALNGEARSALREFDYEDRYFAVCTADRSLFAYGIFDGQTGGYAARFFSEELVLQLLEQAKLFQLQTQLVRRFLLRIFRESDDAYARLTSLQQALQERQELRQQFLRSPSPNTPTPPASGTPTGNGRMLSPILKRDKFDLLEFHHTFPEQAQKYELIESLLRDGASCVVCILAHGKLYTATCGSARAVLCRIKPKGLEVVQLSPNHQLSNDDERLRVHETGAAVALPTDSQNSNNNNNHNKAAGSLAAASADDETVSLLLDPTRVLGNLALKLFYAEYPGLEYCRQSPLTAEPEIGLHSLAATDPKKSLIEAGGFLLLFTDRLEKAVRNSGLLQIPLDADDDRKVAESVNELLCYMVSEEMNQHATVDRVARAVVARITHALRQRKLSSPDTAATDGATSDSEEETCISLLVRNLRHPLPLAAAAGLQQQQQAELLSDGLPAAKPSPSRRLPTRSSSGLTPSAAVANVVPKPTVFDNIVTQNDQVLEHAVSMPDMHSTDAEMSEIGSGNEDSNLSSQGGTPTQHAAAGGGGRDASSLSMSTISDDEMMTNDELRTPWSLFSSAEDVSMRYADSRPNSASTNNVPQPSAQTPQQPNTAKRIIAYTNFSEYFDRLRQVTGAVDEPEPDLNYFLV